MSLSSSRTTTALPTSAADSTVETQAKEGSGWLGSLLRFGGNGMIIGAYIVLGTMLFSADGAGYNHIFGAYLALSLILFNLKLWFGELSVLSLIVVFMNLGLCSWMLVTGNADVVPYMGVALFASFALVSMLLLVTDRPLAFRTRERVAENYIDMAMRSLAALGALGIALAWMPHPNYILFPLLMLIGFKLAYPLRRLIYPLILRILRLEPDSGPPARERKVHPGFSWYKVIASAVSALVILGIALPLLANPTRYDVSVPEAYILPHDGYMKARRIELEQHVATVDGSIDVAALTELGLMYHNLGLIEEPYLDRAEELLSRAVLLDPKDGQALAWYGSNRTAFGLYEIKPLTRVRHVSGGLDDLHRAVELTPDDPIVRLARLDVCLGVPRFFDLMGIAEIDVNRLLELMVTDPAGVDPIRPWIHQRAGDMYAELEHTEEAACHLSAALTMLPADSYDAQRIRHGLDQLAEATEHPLPFEGAALTACLASAHSS